MGQLIMCNICGQEFETEAELKKHEPFCAFNRRKYYLEQAELREKVKKKSRTMINCQYKQVS